MFVFGSNLCNGYVLSLLEYMTGFLQLNKKIMIITKYKNKAIFFILLLLRKPTVAGKIQSCILICISIDLLLFSLLSLSSHLTNSKV